MITIRQTDYVPPRWLRHTHVQSVLASLPARRPWVERRARRMKAHAVPHILDCGGGVRLQGLFSSRQKPSPKGLVVLLHGWEGSADSLYLLSSASRLFDEGYDVFRLHLRDHGPTHHLNPELFHSCRIDEVVGAVRQISRTFEHHHLFMAGFSLGGNFSLRTAARATDAGIPLKKVVAVCPVLDPNHTMWALEDGWRVYHDYFVKKWSRSLEKKRDAFPDQYDLSVLSGLKTLREMTDYFACRFTDFPDMESYFKGYALIYGQLDQLDIPCHALFSLDDPVIPSSDLKKLTASDALTIETLPRGGHCGFFKDHTLRSWAEDRMVQLLT